MFDSLQSTGFRWLWLGRLSFSANMQMGAVVQGWMVYEITGSALSLGWVSAGWSIANSLLSPFGGIISDRLEKRTLLLWVRGALLVSTLVLGLLIWLGVIQVWHLAAGSLLRGALLAIMMPAQNSLLAQLVERKQLLNAVSLNSTGMGLAGIFAASLAGYVIELVGAGGVYFIMGALYAWDLFTIARLPRTGTADATHASAWSDLTQGFKYLRVCPILIPLLGVVFARGLLGMPYRTLMPKYARDVMELDASGLGVLTAAPGIGSLISSLVLASLGDFRGKGKILLVAGTAVGVALVLFANTQSFALVLVLLAFVGAASNASMVTNQTLIQGNCDRPFLGRVMSMYMMMFGIAQLALIPLGAVTDRMGVSFVTTILGTLLALVCVVLLLTRPKLRQLE